MRRTPPEIFLRNISRYRWWFLLGGWLLAVAPLQAEPEPAAWDVAQLMQGLSRVESARARFTEQKYMSILKEPLTTSGLLEFHAPDKLEKHVLKPFEERYRVADDTLVIEEPAQGSTRRFVLQRYPAMWAFVEGLRATLAGDVASLQRFYSIKLQGTQEHWRLDLEPSDKAMQEIVRSIQIQGARNQIDTIEILEKNGDRSVMTIVPESP
jgi:hypothetical protein